MTEISRLENEIKNFREGFDYLVSDNSRGEKTYTVRLEKAKQSLRDIIHSTREWRIEYVAGQKGTEFTTEQNDSFGLYWKSFNADSPDEFVVLDVGNSSRDTSSAIQRKREIFIQSEQRIKDSEQRIKDSEQRIKDSEQRIKDLQIGQPRVNAESESNINFSIGKNEKGEWEKGMSAEGCPNQTIKDLLSKWENEGLFRQRNNQQKEKDEDFTQHHQIPPKK